MKSFVTPETLRKFINVFAATLVILILIALLISLINIDLTDLFHRHIDSTSFYIEFAPEIWLTLMSIVLGTLIIVISIASQSNPKLIDYYIGDYPSLFYTCGITFAGIQNIYLQLNLSVDSLFWKNLIFVNAYVLLPLAIINAIPYAFYILSYTKTSSLIKTIYKKNRDVLFTLTKGKKHSKPEEMQFSILDTINQLDDQLGFVDFKEPKSKIIEALSKLLKYNLHHKNSYHEDIFRIGNTISHDISFRTLSDKFEEIERNKTFIEHKILRIYSGFYNQLIDQGHHDLASQCAHELSLIGITAAKTRKRVELELVLMQFNTFLRFGIKHATQTKDVRNVYNCVFHYTRLILYFIKRKEERLILKACQYLTYYGREVYKLSFTENYFIFLIDCFASEVQRILIEAHSVGINKSLQMKILKIYANLEPEIEDKNLLGRARNNKSRSIKIALILYYLHHNETTYAQQLIEDIIDDLRYFNATMVIKLIKKDCSFLAEGSPVFWEYTDRGDKNIYFTPHKEHLGGFLEMFKLVYRKSKNYNNLNSEIAA